MKPSSKTDLECLKSMTVKDIDYSNISETDLDF